MITDKKKWPELNKTYEDLLCPPLSRPLSKHGSLRNNLNTLANALCPTSKNAREGGRKRTNGDKCLIELNHVQPEGSYHDDSRSRVYINPDDINLLWNAILLQGLFGDPKTAIALIAAKDKRAEYCDWARSVFLDRQSVGGLGLVRTSLMELLDLLPLADLKAKRLPNPFADALPQMGLGPHKGNLLKTLAAQTASLSIGDSMMAYYLDGDIEKAYEAANALPSVTGWLAKYQALILKKYKEAKEFDDLLDMLK